MFTTIAVAVDGSPYGERALAVARSLVGEKESRLAIVHVVELVGGKGGVHPLAADEDRRRADIQSRVDELNSEGIRAELFTPTTRLGGPAHAIVEVAESIDADVIVVGSRGRSLVSKVVLGSVPIRLLQVAHCPVLVVPPSGA